VRPAIFAAIGIALVSYPVCAFAQAADPVRATGTIPAPAITPATPTASATGAAPPQAEAPRRPAPSRYLPAGAPVFVTLDKDISSQDSAIGDRFCVTVARDVTLDETVVIPAGARGTGEITFLTRRGSFGKPGIVGIALRTLDVAGQPFALDGRYREEGRNSNGGAAATMFVAGIFAAAVKGSASEIPAGRELKARTGETIAFDPAAPPPVPSDPVAEFVAPPCEPPAAAPTATASSDALPGEPAPAAALPQASAPATGSPATPDQN